MTPQKTIYKRRCVLGSLNANQLKGRIGGCDDDHSHLLKFKQLDHGCNFSDIHFVNFFQHYHRLGFFLHS